MDSSILGCGSREAPAMSSAAVTAPRSKRGLAGADLRRRIFGGRPDPVFLVALLFILLIVLCAIAPNLIAPYEPAKMSKDLLRAPSRTHWLGTDEFGRDILSRIIHGARVELVISILGV